MLQNIICKISFKVRKQQGNKELLRGGCWINLIGINFFKKKIKLMICCMVTTIHICWYCFKDFLKFD